MTGPFESAARVEPMEPGVYRAHVAEDWYQGRGAFGGLVAAQLLGAMEHVVGDKRPARTLTVHFCAPVVAGDVSIRAQIERAGSLVSHLSAKMEQQEKIVAIGSGVFAAPRTGADLAFVDTKAPDVSRPADTQGTPPNGMLPRFAHHLEYRFVSPHFPFSGSAEARVAAWIRTREHAAYTPSLLAALIDALPPAALARARMPRPGASMDYSAQFFLHGKTLPPDAWVLIWAHSRWAADGYADEWAEVWSEDGQLLAQCRQMVALL